MTNKHYFPVSKFHLDLAKAVMTQGDSIISLVGLTVWRRFSLSIFLPLKSIFTKNKIILFDHRNLITVSFSFLILLRLISKSRVFIAEDGFHTLLVDNYGKRFLFWNVSSLKKIPLILFSNLILKLNRIHLLSSFTVDVNKKSSCKRVIFIDQGGFRYFYNDQFFTSIGLFFNSSVIHFAVHPALPISNLPSNTVELNTPLFSNLCCNDILVGFASTALLVGKNSGLKCYFLDIESLNFSCLLTSDYEYISAIQKLLSDYNVQKISF